MIFGTLIKESIIDELILDLIIIDTVDIWIAENHTENQPKYWTAISFRSDNAEFVDELAKVLKDEWYVDLKTETKKILVFKNKIFTYTPGDVEGKKIAMKYCRDIGLPESQIDWTD